MTLQIKVPLLTIMVLLVLGTITGGALLYSQRRHAIGQFKETAQTVNSVIQGSLKHDMLTGNRSDVQQALQAIGDNQFISRASVLLPDGTIVASSDIGEIGKTASGAEVASVLSDESSRSGFSRLGGERIYVEVSPVVNEPACQGCHAPEQRLLGAIEVSVNTSSLSTYMQEETLLIVTFGAATFVLVGGGLALMLRKTVLNRISALARTAQRLSEGDYSARLSLIRSRDEVGVLATSFNEMAANVEERNREIEESRRQLAQWNAELEDRVGRRTSELSAMNTVLTTLSRSSDPDSMLTEVLGQIMGLMRIESGAVYGIHPESDGLVEVAALGPPMSGADRLDGQEPEEIALQVAKSHEQKVAAAGNASGEGPGLRSFAFLPIGSPRTIGVLALASLDSGKFEPERMKLLSSMCDAIGIAMEKAATANAVQEANKIRKQLLEKLISSQEEERRRIARDLHDEASQSLAAVAINLEDVANTLPARYEKTRERLHMLKGRMESTLSDIRGLALDLRPSALDDLGLSAAIDWYARDYLKKRDLDVCIEITGRQKKLPTYTETMMFRIVQEALTNVVRHAQASSVRLHLGFAEAKVILRIEDNGTGFDVGKVVTKQGLRENLGVYGMTERATLLGGTLKIHSEPSRGTVLTVEIPLENAGGQQSDEDQGLPG